MCGSASDRMRAMSWGETVMMFPAGCVPRLAIAFSEPLLEAKEANSGLRCWPHIGRGRTDHAAGAALLQRMRDPGRRPRHGEDRREGRAWQTDGVEQERGVHLDIGLEAPAGLAALERSDGGLLDPFGEGEVGTVGVKPE